MDNTVTVTPAELVAMRSRAERAGDHAFVAMADAALTGDAASVAALEALWAFCRRRHQPTLVLAVWQ